MTQLESDRAVTPTATTCLVLTWMKNNTYRVYSQIVSTVRKSHATIPSAWALRDCVQVSPQRRGAGPSPCRRSSDLMVVAPTDAELAELAADPDAAQRGFSLAIRSTSATTSALIGGRPGWRTLLVGPLVSHQVAVPAQQGLGRDQEH
jgi:hypothetical protein